MKHIKESNYTPIVGPSKVNYGLPLENNGLVYKVMPLATNLSQKGNDYALKTTSKCKYKLGDVVSGECVYDKKEHLGTITNIILDANNNIQLIYILDVKSKELLALKPSTVYFSYYNDQTLEESFNEIKDLFE